MKKLFLTLTTAALFGVAAMSQDQDTTREESNQFREMPPQEEDTTGTEDYQYRMDTTSFDEDLQEDTTGMGNQYQDLEDEEISLDSTINDLNQELEEGEQNLEEGVQEGEQSLEEGEQNLREEGQELEQDAEEAGNEMERSAEEARDTLEQSAEEAGKAMQNDSESAMQDNQDSENTSGASEATASNEPVEVVDGKEGPNNEVVYEYKGEMFYVDRDKKQIVKVKRSDLKDSDHEVRVKDPLATDQKSDNKKRSKG